jgi:hypothetical protein
VKKVLIGVGIGCGVLLLLLVAGLFVAGMWVKDTMGEAVAAGQTMQAQESTMAELDKEFPFKAPADGALLALDGARLEAWLRVNESGYANFEKFEQVNASLKEEMEAAKDREDTLAQMNKGLKAAGGIITLLTEVRTTMLASLGTEKMSPTEYRAISQTVLGSLTQKAYLTAGESMAQAREAMAAQRVQFEAQLADPAVPAEQKELLKQTLAALDESAKSMDDAPAELEAGADPKVVNANVALLEKYKERLEKAANPLLIGVLLDGAKGMDGMNQAAE